MYSHIFLSFMVYEENKHFYFPLKLFCFPSETEAEVCSPRIFTSLCYLFLFPYFLFLCYIPSRPLHWEGKVTHPVTTVAYHRCTLGHEAWLLSGKQRCEAPVAHYILALRGGATDAKITCHFLHWII